MSDPHLVHSHDLIREKWAVLKLSVVVKNVRQLSQAEVNRHVPGLLLAV